MSKYSISMVEPYSLFRMEQLVGRCGVVEALVDSFKISVYPNSRTEWTFYLGVIGGLFTVFVILVAVVCMWKKNVRLLKIQNMINYPLPD